jgi:hypothetical protein
MPHQAQPRGLIKGERVRVRKLGTNDEWCYGEVILVSPNGAAVALGLEGIVRSGDGFITGIIPLNVDLKAGRVTGLTDDEYEIEVPHYDDPNSFPV